jgi:pyruvate/2-oxoglutarate dehydrogenase complex dihydrolipoamide dehydrogenase (E3) component
MAISDPEEFDLVVLGGGPVGEHAVGRARKAGLETVLVEQELIGGECSYWACMPSKTLLRPGHVLGAARAVPGAREAVTGSIDVAAALARRDWMTADWDDSGQVEWVEGTGGHIARGHGHIVAERTVVVDSREGTRTLVARRAVLVATGSSAFIPPVPGLAATRHWDNRQVTAAHTVPRRLVVVGGGAVGVEMAQAWRRLGSVEVTIVEAGERLLANAEPFVGEQLAAALEREGITVLTRATITRVGRADDDAPVEVTLEGGRVVTGDEILVAAGRRPRTVDIGLEVLGLEPGSFLDVDEQLRVRAVPGAWLYAAGDVNGIALLTHMGKYQARIAVDAILGGSATADADASAVPAVVFTDPQVAWVGLTENAARDRGIDVGVATVKTQSVAAAAILGEGVEGTSQLVIDKSRGTVVGATFTGPDIAELLHSATIAVVAQVPLERLRHSVPSFPTLSEVWLELVDTALSI